MRLNFSDKKKPKKGLFTFLNPYSYYVMKNNEVLLENFDRVYCDGVLLSFILKILGVKVNRVSFDMTSLAPIIFDFAEEKALSIAMIGGIPGVAEQAAKIFLEKYPSLNFVILNSGYFNSDDERKKVLKKIKDKSPDIVIVGMGALLQELFLIDLKKIGWNGYGYTCGGFLHQSLVNGVNYYPELLNKLNLRWCYRIYKEPYLLKRYFLYYPVAVFIFLFKHINKK